MAAIRRDRKTDSCKSSLWSWLDCGTDVDIKCIYIPDGLNATTLKKEFCNHNYKWSFEPNNQDSKKTPKKLSLIDK